MVSLVALAGCTKESPEGGPGAVQNGNGEVRPNGTDTGAPNAVAPNGRPVDADEATFNLNVPATATNVERGKTATATISIDRGDAFKQPVDLEFRAPAGINVKAQDKRLDPNEDEIEITIEAAPTAQVGEHVITVIGRPQTGKETSVQFHVEVEAADNDGAAPARETVPPARETVPPARTNNEATP
jgi:hypothetical protein